MRVGILSVLFHWYILSAWYKCLGFLSPLAKENRKVAWGWASLNNAVEKVLEERKKPKVMRKDEVGKLFYWPRRGRQGWYHDHKWMNKLWQSRDFSFPEARLQELEWLKIHIRGGGRWRRRKLCFLFNSQVYLLSCLWSIAGFSNLRDLMMSEGVSSLRMDEVGHKGQTIREGESQVDVTSLAGCLDEGS